MFSDGSGRFLYNPAHRTNRCAPVGNGVYRASQHSRVDRRANVGHGGPPPPEACYFLIRKASGFRRHTRSRSRSLAPCRVCGRGGQSGNVQLNSHDHLPHYPHDAFGHESSVVQTGDAPAAHIVRSTRGQLATAREHEVCAFTVDVGEDGGPERDEDNKEARGYFA